MEAIVDHRWWKSARRNLKVSLGLIVFVAALQTLGDWLHAMIRLDPGVVNIATLLGIFVLLLLWSIWLIRFGWGGGAGRWLSGLAVLALPLVFYLLSRPVLTGDIGIARFDGPIWQRTEAVINAASQNKSGNGPESPKGSEAVDLLTTTAEDYPQFLGPNRNGTSAGPKLASDWARSPPTEVWRVPVGMGWSGVSIVNGWAVTMEQLGNDECVSCFALEDGHLEWRYQYVQRHEDTAGMGKPGPRATPTVNEGLVYTQGAAGKIVCLDGKNGLPIWEQDVCELLGITRTPRTTLDGFEYLVENSSLAWGRAGSPLIVDDVVVVPGGGPPGGPYKTLLALDKKTGKLRWTAGEEMIAYGSPSLGTLLGTRQIMLVAERTAFGFDASTGAELWKHTRPGSSSAAANCSQVTWVDDNRVLMSKGYGLGGELVEFSRTEQGVKPKTVWKSSRVLTTKFSNPVIRDGHVYALADGFLECVELETGKLVWSLRDKFGHGQLLLVGDLLVVHSEFGKLGIFPAIPEKPKWELKIPTIKGLCWNTLALSGNRLIVRSDLEMACFELPLAEVQEVKK